MKTQFNFKKHQVYFIIPLIISIATISLPGSFILVGLVQFLIGSVQLIISLTKTIAWLVQGKSMPKLMQYYWVMVITYFAIGFAVAFIMDMASFSNTGDLKLNVSLIYFSIAWSIAIYNFKHIVLLKNQ